MATALGGHSSVESVTGHYAVSLPFDHYHSASNHGEGSMLPCPFCDEPQSSTEFLRQHLMLCGNKTDECPKCRRFIPRAVFAYHYENNCASIAEIDTSPRSSRAKQGSRSSSSRLLNQIPNVPVYAQSHITDFRADDYQPKSTENEFPIQATNYQFYGNDCAIAEHGTHQRTCHASSKNDDQRTQRAFSRSSTTQNRPSDSRVLIPCEFCNEQVDLVIWSIHTQDCREKENRELQARARGVSGEPMIENVPCEYCEELHTPVQHPTHKLICLKNPERILQSVKLSNTRPSSTVSLLNTASKDSAISLPPPKYSNNEISTSTNNRLHNSDVMGRRSSSTMSLEPRVFSRPALRSGQSTPNHRATVRPISSASNDSAYHAARSATPTRLHIDERTCSNCAASSRIAASRVPSAATGKRNSRGSLQPSSTKAHTAFHSVSQENQHEPKVMQNQRPTQQKSEKSGYTD